MCHANMPCYSDPLTPHFSIVKLGFTGVYIFLNFAFKYRSMVLVRTISVSDSHCTPDLCFKQNTKKKLSQLFQLKIIIFTALKKRSILHRSVIVMASLNDTKLGARPFLASILLSPTSLINSILRSYKILYLFNTITELV